MSDAARTGAPPADDFIAHKALGPYPHSHRWRVIEVARDGRRRTDSYATKSAAEHHCDRVNAQHGMSTIAAIDAYLASLSERSRPTAKAKLYGLLRIGKADRLEGAVDRPLATITAVVARKLYERRVAEGYAGASLHGEVGYASRMFAWAVERGIVKDNPFANIEVTVPRKRGKPKLRVSASKQLIAYLWGNPSVESTAVLMAFVLALRAGEVVNRVVEDLDDDGRLLWIRDTKTAAGDREIEVPELLRQRLLPLTRNPDGTPRAPQERLFVVTKGLRAGSKAREAWRDGSVTRHWLHYWTTWFCKKAGVPRVTPHGLRGSGATNSVRMGQSIGDVARAIGHADGGRTLQRHYLGGGAIESARGRQMAGLLAGAVVGDSEQSGSGDATEATCCCPSCGSDVQPSARFCAMCGHRVGSAAEPDHADHEP